MPSYQKFINNFKYIKMKKKYEDHLTMVNNQLKTYKKLKQKKADVSQSMKEIEENMASFANMFPEKFDGKTLTLENGKLKWTQISKVEVPKKFDIHEFMKEFPTCVKIDLSVSKVKGAMETNAAIDRYKLKINSTDQLKVEV